MRVKRVLLIGWDGADWKIIHPLIEAGKMPNLERFINEGVMGNLATLYPSLSPMLWTSIATGKRPYKHRVLGFIEPDPSGEGVRPITTLSRKTRAIWNIFTLVGKKCVVVGWWPSHPVEPINGVMVSNHYQRAVVPYGKPWPVRPGSIYPERLIRPLAQLRLHPQELDVGLILKFLPKLSEIDQEKDRRVENIAKIIADCTTINRAATAILDHEPWDFAAVYYDAIDHFCHGFINYHPPKLPWINERDYELYKNIVESGYIYHDLLLGTLLKRAGDDTVVILVSDHGFHSDQMRPRHIPMEPAGPALQHRHYGIFVAKGPGIKKDEIIYGASLLDVCPTVLTILGLPVGEDMDGKPLVNIFEQPPKIRVIPSWDDVPGEDGSHPPDWRIDPIETKEAIKQLVELGYIEEPDKDKQKAVEDCVRELHYNEARSYMDAGLYSKAIPMLEDLYERYPDEYRFGIQLVSCYQAIEQTVKARRVLEEVFERKRKNTRKARLELKGFREKMKDKSPEEWTQEDHRRLRKLRAEAGRNPYTMEFLMGSLLFKEDRLQEALKHLKAAERTERSQPALYTKLGEVYLKIKRWDKAERCYRKASEIDPESAEACLGLCRVYLGRRENERAVEAGLDAVGLQFHNPRAHYFLGVALHRTGRLYEAVQALKLAVHQNPNFPEAHRRLAYIYRNRLKDELLADRHKRLAEEAARRLKLIKEGKLSVTADKTEEATRSITSDQVGLLEAQQALLSSSFEPDTTVVIVSGLPRSGTSMMMQMLKEGGFPILTDDLRKPDEDNPKGYLEFEKAKQLKRDASWLPDAKGKAVKIVTQLLYYLPRQEDINYRIIFMLRNLDEVVASQRRMLQRQGKKGATLSDETLKKIFSHQLTQARLMLAAREIPTLYVDYNETLLRPEETAKRVNQFLNGRLDEERMCRAVDPSLKRQGRGIKC
jgi:predicted AlkP superfamily phosphohydrolase/phosphomutase/tetratricopeptide (TPR) repeat protein